MSTGKVRREFGADTPELWPLWPAFTPDGRRIAVSYAEGTILFWDIAPPGSAIAPADARELDALWGDLASADAARAYIALCRLTAHPGQALPLLRQHLRPVTAPDPEQLTRLIAALDHERFAVRQQAIADLEALGERALPALRQALAAQPSAEAKTSLERLLARFDGPLSDPETLRALRGIEALERMATPEARQLLTVLAQGLDGTRITIAAQSGLDRLTRSTFPR